MKKYVCDVCGYVYDPKLVILTMLLNRELPLKLFLTIGFVLNAA